MHSVGALRGELDFSKCRSLRIDNADVSHADMRFNPLANTIRLGRVNGLRGDLDFSGVSNLSILYADLSKATPQFNSFGATVDIRGSQGLHGDLDFSNVRHLYVGGTDLSGVTSIKLPPSTDGYIDTDRSTILMRVGKSKLQYKIAQFQQKLKSKFTNPGQDK